MKGARVYASIFKSGQYGRLYITSGNHARGRTFRVQVLPIGEKAILNGPSNECLNVDAVTVYGVLGGNCGWTEYYGWIHKGKWQEDFYRLVVMQRNTIKINNDKNKARCDLISDNESDRVNSLLNSY